jgi:hypothetical protein
LLLQRINRFARFWDMIGNSGRFKHALPLLLGNEPFAQFLLLSDSIFELSGQTHKISLLRLYDLVYESAATTSIDSTALIEFLYQDFSTSGLKSVPKCLRNIVSKSKSTLAAERKAKNSSMGSRQARHQT